MITPATLLGVFTVSWDDCQDDEDPQECHDSRYSKRELSIFDEAGQKGTHRDS